MDAHGRMTPDNTDQSEQIVLNLDLKKPEKKIKKWPFIVGAVALVVVLLIALWNPIVGLIKGNLTQKTIADYESEAFDRLTESIVDGYQAVFASQEHAPVGVNNHITFDINQLALKMIEQQMPELADIGALNEMSVDAAIENDGNKVSISVSPDHANAELPAINLQYEPETNYVYVILAGLTDNYLDFDLSELGDETDILGVFADPANLPTADELESFLDRYFDELVGLMGDEFVSEETVSVDGVEQTCKVHTTVMDYKAVMELNKRYAQELMDFVSCDAESADVFWENKEYASITWTDYIDSEGRIVGRKINCDDETVLNYIVAVNENKFAVRAALFTVDISGSGKIKDKALDGEFVVEVDGEDYLEIETKDISVTDMTSGKLSGTMEIKLTDQLVEKLLGDDLGLPMVFDIQFDIEKDNCQYTVSYMDMASVIIDVTKFVPESISLPDGEAINGADTDAMYRWLQGMDTQKLQDELEKIGLSGLMKWFGVLNNA